MPLGILILLVIFIPILKWCFSLQITVTEQKPGPAAAAHMQIQMQRCGEIERSLYLKVT